MKKNELLGFFLLFVFLRLVFYVSTASDKASMTLDQKTYTLLFGECIALIGIVLLIKSRHTAAMKINAVKKRLKQIGWIMIIGSVLALIAIAVHYSATPSVLFLCAGGVGLCLIATSWNIKQQPK